MDLPRKKSSIWTYKSTLIDHTEEYLTYTNMPLGSKVEENNTYDVSCVLDQTLKGDCFQYWHRVFFYGTKYGDSNP